MKFNLLITTCAGILIFYGCQKNESHPLVQNGSTGTQKLQAFSNLQSDDVQRTAFRLLTSEEKYTVWINHLKEYQNSSLLSEDQKQVVKDAMQFLSIDFFKNKNQIGSEKFAILQYKMKSLFTKDLGMQIFASLNNKHSIANSVYSKTRVSNCGCSQISDWCFLSNCGQAYNCNQTGDGCGTFLNYPCNGSCN